MNRSKLLRKTIAALESETIAFQNRVTADGGEIIDLQYLDDTIKKQKKLGVRSDISFWGDANIAVKKNSNNEVEKLYDTSQNNNDLTADSLSNSPKLISSSSYDGKKVLEFDGDNDYLTSNSVSIDNENITTGITGNRVGDSRGLGIGLINNTLFRGHSLELWTDEPDADEIFIYYGDGSSFDQTFISYQNEDLSTPQTIIQKRDNTVVSLLKDGVISDIDTISISGVCTRIYLGSRDGSNRYEGNMSTGLIFSSAISDDNIIEINSFINKYYRI